MNTLVNCARLYACIYIDDLNTIVNTHYYQLLVVYTWPNHTKLLRIPSNDLSVLHRKQKCA